MGSTQSSLDNVLLCLNDEKLDMFWEFIEERQRTWYRRVIEGKAAPWTNDKILQRCRFTNVYRELDPGTQYVIQNILENDAHREDKIFNVMLYRLIGRLETHEYLGFQSLEEFSAKELEEVLKRRRDELDETVFTGAYMVSGYNHRGSSDKVENVASIFGEISANQEFFSELLLAESPKKAYQHIKNQPGFGNFLSYQVLVDLLYPIEYYDFDSVLGLSADEWSTPGPGAKKGLKILKRNDEYSHLQIMKALHQRQKSEFEKRGLDFPYLVNHKKEEITLSLSDIQNCLCEFYKYHKILNSNGRTRRCFRHSEARPNEELLSIYNQAPRIDISSL